MRFTWIGSVILIGSILCGTYELLIGCRRYHRQGSNKSEILHKTCENLKISLNIGVVGIVLLLLGLIINLFED